MRPRNWKWLVVLFKVTVMLSRTPQLKCVISSPIVKCTVNLMKLKNAGQNANALNMWMSSTVSKERHSKPLFLHSDSKGILFDSKMPKICCWVFIASQIFLFNFTHFFREKVSLIWSPVSVAFRRVKSEGGSQLALLNTSGPRASHQNSS